MTKTIFTKIINGEIPCHKVYEDDNFFAFLDINPLNKGHTLVIPKKHVRWVWDVENIGEYYKVVQKIVLAQKKAFNTDFVVSLVFGEEVPHAHVHLVPRFEGDGHGGSIDMQNHKKISDDQLDVHAKSIKDALSVL